jgi:hypothetical protein
MFGLSTLAQHLQNNIRSRGPIEQDRLFTRTAQIALTDTSGILWFVHKPRQLTTIIAFEEPVWQRSVTETARGENVSFAQSGESLALMDLLQNEYHGFTALSYSLCRELEPTGRYKQVFVNVDRLSGSLWLQEFNRQLEHMRNECMKFGELLRPHGERMSRELEQRRCSSAIVDSLIDLYNQGKEHR